MSEIDSGRLTRTLKRQFERLYAEVPDIAPPPDPKIGGQRVPGWLWEYAQVEWPERRYARYADGPTLGAITLLSPTVEALGGGMTFVFGRCDGGGRLAVPLSGSSVFDAETVVLWPDGRRDGLGPWRDFFGYLSLDLTSEAVWRGVDLIVGPGFVAEVSGRAAGLHVEDATMRGYRFKNAPIGAATFRNVRMEEVFFPGADLTGATFERCQLQETRFVGTDLDNASFEGSTLWGVELERASLAGARFAGAQLMQCVLTEVRAQGARFGGSTWSGMEVHGADLRGASFERTRLSDLKFVGCQLDATTWTGARFEGVVFEDCRFEGATMRQLSGSDAVWVECDLGAAELDHGRITSTQFIRCTSPPGGAATTDGMVPLSDLDDEVDPLGHTQQLAPVAGPPPRPLAPPPRPTPAPPVVVPAPQAPVTVPAPVEPAPVSEAPALERPPWVYALASLIVPGLGQFMLGQTSFGIVLIAIAILTACGGGMVNLIAAVLAYMEASRRVE